MTLMCVLVSCHDLLTHAAGLIVNHHLVLLCSHEGGGVVHLRGKLPVGCSCCRLKFFVCFRGNDVVFIFLPPCISCPYTRCRCAGFLH